MTMLQVKLIVLMIVLSVCCVAEEDRPERSEMKQLKIKVKKCLRKTKTIAFDLKRLKSSFNKMGHGDCCVNSDITNRTGQHNTIKTGDAKTDAQFRMIERQLDVITDIQETVEKLEVKSVERHNKLKALVEHLRQEYDNNLEQSNSRLDHCERKIKTFGYTLAKLKESIQTSLANEPHAVKPRKRRSVDTKATLNRNDGVMRDCRDILDAQQYPDKPRTGVYTITIPSLPTSLDVLCDMTTDGGGWTVFQNRFDGTIDFFRTFFDYENGFGNANGEFWLGLKYIHALTKSVNTTLRVDLMKSDGTRSFRKFEDFSVSEGPEYALNVGESSGTLQDALSYNNGSRFHTYDKDGTNRKCATRNHAGWWFNDCTITNLNGEYVTPGEKSTIHSGEAGMYHVFFDYFRSLASTRLMFRRIT